MLQISDCDSVTVVTVVTRKNFHFPQKKTYFSFLWFTNFFTTKKTHKIKKKSNCDETQNLKF